MLLSLLGLKFLILLLLLLLSGFFSGSETALIAIGKVRARALVKQGVKGAKEIDELMNQQEAMLTTVLIGNNMVNIGASALATSIAMEFFGSYGVAIATGVMTFLILTFAEIMPKTIAVHHAERISIIVSKPIKMMAYFFMPFIKVVSAITGTFERFMGMAPYKRRVLTEEEVETMLDIGEEEGAIEEDEKEMMMGVLKLDEIRVRNVMTPKDAMVCIDVNQSVDDAVELIKRTGFSRIPVFERTEDNIVGILYAKDLLANRGETSIRKLMKPPYLISDTKRVDDLLKEFQRGRFHIAIVVDNQGKTEGLVCLEDLLEVIVGSIYDEYDIISRS
ncbi:MAG: CNNM domain-containing protein [Methanophagales archaeon]|nr:CNNM domain-containing protein [Methanophagales archaeon]MCW3139858.1 CNNM domain-containing protein [Methanophagales archaeon]MCW7070253.1 CNNM domain-containing protein [Methanophagales archaeon]MCW7072443.1 CNNM domain-containing protein [Methanophagales archaeon]